MSIPPLLRVDGLHVRYPVRKGLFGGIAGHINAVDGVSLTLDRGETLGLVGESGCGKSTLGRTVIALQKPSEGQVLFRNQDLFALRPEELKQQRRFAQLIFQNPRSCFDPRRTVGSSVRMALDIQEMLDPSERDDAVADIFRKVGLRPEHRFRYPHELSGGQLQRIGIARALILKPSLIVCDEPVSALDVSVQAQILNLLSDLKAEFQLALLFVSHNLAVVEYIADRVAVMYYGRIVEIAPTRQLFSDPRHPYTRALLAAVPSIDIGRRDDPVLRLADPPDPAHLPTGCRFRTRCPLAFARCVEAEPPMAMGEGGHRVACWATGETAMSAVPAATEASKK
ncbi:oligopeptide/dipeptide ABC transporter ATP-binding protein [Rhizobium sp. BK376]|uniref:ABC transporter ATP-binding protein n=1 Tax=Rhizobium sp. BK376 TaxID=2512149 RepID=UPI001045774D|nr:oligopeptide/dipeptide ABC transporter ATP-binding protein [Rhizobium sp. BK376]TCR72643.1 peptide/nickel transport system ATP-binding protein/oligopeptide transport system ATP-binding protein [Rhizobium sp. BK376]